MRRFKHGLGVGDSNNMHTSINYLWNEVGMEVPKVTHVTKQLLASTVDILSHVCFEVDPVMDSLKGVVMSIFCKLSCRHATYVCCNNIIVIVLLINTITRHLF